jgi:hypothetical protein
LIWGKRWAVWNGRTSARDATRSRRSRSTARVCLDFHGDPVRAKLVVFSDGNHHMALGECLEHFLAANPGAGDVFYAATPPRVIVERCARAACGWEIWR